MTRSGFRWALALAAAGLWPGLLPAQTVRGQVKDRTTGKPAHGVVTMVDTSGVLVDRVPTGPQGQYVLQAPGPGSYLLQFVGPGYGPFVTRPFSLRAGETRIQGLEVVPLPPVVLDTVVVEGRPVPRRLLGFYQRKSGGFGEFASREDLERTQPQQPTDLFRRMMGVSVVPTDAGYRLVNRRSSGCSPAIFLDGIYMGTGLEFDFDGLLTTEQIEAVEVYGGAGQVPPEFNRGDCGAVVIWTRVAGPGTETVITHFYLGGELGGWISSEGLKQARAGGRAVIARGVVEIVPAVKVLVPSLQTGGAAGQSGTEFLASLRVRFPRRGQLGYAGLGVSALQLQGRSGGPQDEQHFLLLVGASPVRGGIRPFVEFQLHDPFAGKGSRPQVFTGIVLRLY